MLQGGQVMLVLQADDRAFLTQVTNAGQRAGQRAGEAMVREINSALGNIKIPSSILRELANAGKQLSQPVSNGNGNRSNNANSRNNDFGGNDSAKGGNRGAYMYGGSKAVDPKDKERKTDSDFNRIESDKLKTKLSTATDVTQQINLKFEIDKIAIKEKYAQAIHEIEKELNGLAARAAAGREAGTTTQHIDRMTYAANKKLEMTTKNREAAFQAHDINRGVVGVTPRSPNTRSADPRDELRKIDSNFNKIEKEKLKTQLAGTTDVSKQVGLKLEIDRIDVKEKYAKAVHEIEKEIRNLESRTATAVATGAPTSHLGRMTYAANKQLEMTTKNRDAALSALDNPVAKTGNKKPFDHEASQRKADSQYNRVTKSSLTSLLNDTVDVSQKASIKLQIDRVDIREKYEKAAYEIAKEIKSLEAEKNKVASSGGSTAKIDYRIKDLKESLHTNDISKQTELRSVRIQEAGGANPRAKLADPKDEARRLSSLANKDKIEALQTKLAVTTEVKDRMYLTLEIDKTKIKEKYEQAAHQIDKELKDLNARKVTATNNKESTANIDALITGNQQRKQTLETNRDRALEQAKTRYQGVPKPQKNEGDEFRRANSVANNLAIDALKTKLSTTTDVTEKLNLKIEIDRAQINEKYLQARYQLDKQLEELEKRKATTQANGGGPVATANLDLMIGKTEQNLATLKANQTAALAAVGVVTPPPPPRPQNLTTKALPSPKDEMRRSESALNRTQIDGLQNKLLGTTDVRKRITVNLEIDKAQIKEKYAEAIHKAEAELKRLSDAKKTANDAGQSISIHHQVLINNATRNLANITANRTDAFRGAEIAAQNAVRKINNTFFGITIPDSGGQFAKGLRYAISPAFASSIGQGIGAGIMNGIMSAVQIGIGGVVGLIKDAIEVGGDFQKSRVTFTSILGSPEEADKMLKMIQKLAEVTPFEIKGLRESSQKLTAVGVKDVDKNKETLTMIGNVAAGTGTPIEDMTQMYAKAKANQRVYTREIRQLSDKGVPAVEMLAKNKDIAPMEVKKLLESGQVTFEDYNKILEQLTEADGMFNNLMEKQAATVLGKLSNLNDQFTNIKISLFDALNPATTSIIDILAASVKGVADNDAQFASLNEKAKEFADNMAANPENAEAIQKAISDLATEGFNILIDQAEALVNYLKENPNAIADSVTAAKDLALVLKDIVGLVGMVISGWQQIGTLIKGVENKAIESTLSSTEKIEAERRAKAVMTEDRKDIRSGTIFGSKLTYDKAYEQAAIEVRAESAIKRQKRNLSNSYKPKDNVLLGEDGKQIPNLVDGKQEKLQIGGKPIMGPGYPSSNTEIIELNKAAKDAKNKPERPESNADNTLVKKQNEQIRKAESSLRIARQRARVESLAPDAPERISLERELAISEVKEKHSEKLAKLRVELADYEKKKAVKIKEGRKGGINFDVAIDKTRKLLIIEQQVLSAEVASTASKFDNQQIESKRAAKALKKSGVNDLARAKDSNEQAQLSAQSEAQTPNSQKQQQINYKITVAAIKSKYRDTDFTQQERLTELQNKQEDKIRRKEIGGTDYLAAIARQREIIRLTQSTKGFELAGAESKRNYEIKTSDRAKTKERTDAENSSRDSLNVSTSNLNQARYKIDIAGTSATQDRANKQQTLDIMAKRDAGILAQNQLVYKINEAEKAQIVQKESGDTGGVNYDEVIKGLQTELDQSKAQTALEVQLLEQDKKRNDVIRAREKADRTTSSNRANRDKKITDEADDKISALEDSKAGITDPLTIARLENDINNIQIELNKTKDLNSLLDQRTDLKLKKARAAQNVGLGINDTSLDGATLDEDLANNQSQTDSVNKRYLSKKRAVEKQFVRTVADTTRARLLADGKQIDETKIKALQDSLVDIKDEKVKVVVQFEIDQIALTRGYIEAQAQLQQEIEQLQQQESKLTENGLPVPVELKAQIVAKEKTRADIRNTYQDTLKGNETRFIDNKVLADVRTKNNFIAREKGIFTPSIDADEVTSQTLIAKKDFAGAAKYGRRAALEKERLRYEADKNQNNEFAAQQSLAGSPIDPVQLRSMGDSIDYLNKLNLENITKQFDDMAKSINESAVALQELGKSQTTEFIQGLLSGTKSFGDLWNDLVDNILDGMAQLIAKQFSDQLFGATAGQQGGGGGLLGGAFNFVGGLLGGGGGGGGGGAVNTKGIDIGLGPIIPGFAGGGVPVKAVSNDYRSGNSPIAVALRKEGPASTATLVAATIGERILSLQETAAYHNLFPNGIMNYNAGGIVGTVGGSSIGAGSATGGGSINLGGGFNVGVDVSNNSKPDNQLAELVPKLMAAMRNTIQDETRPNGIIHRFARS